MKNTFSRIGVQTPEVFLPRPETDLTRWAVVACDQFTSQPEYWQEVERLVGAAPSALKLILPEVYLDQPGEAERIRAIQRNMKDYLTSQTLLPRDGLVYVERTFGPRLRRGLIVALDLERYDYSKGSQSLIRATEGTIVERLPPRMRIRENALLELPHILVLIDDPERSVIEPVGARKSNMTKLYDFDLMLGSGHLAGYWAHSSAIESGVVSALEKLADPAVFQAKYGVGADKGVLLFAMGDGNHSLATAKAIWEKMKVTVGPDHPARFALVEIENVHDQGLEFEPIHRVVFGISQDVLAAFRQFYAGRFTYRACASRDEAVRLTDQAAGPGQMIGVIRPGEFGVVEIQNPPSNLPVGTLQAFLDSFLKAGSAQRIDYVHGTDVLGNLGAQVGNAGFYLPAMNKSDLFKTVILDGVLPRKTFSMGEAKEKRFYMEARRISL
jgi:hypothetical protein